MKKLINFLGLAEKTKNKSICKANLYYLDQLEHLRNHNVSGFTEFPTCVGVDLHHHQGNLYRTL
jgi:hypothetical protein